MQQQQADDGCPPQALDTPTRGRPELVLTSEPRSPEAQITNSSRDVTVVIPTHDRADLMPATLSSVLNQRFVDLRVVIVDDGSRDQTPEILEAIDDPRVRWLRQEPTAGVSNARNAGLALVDTDWVAFTDDDDLWAPTKLAQQLDAVHAQAGASWSCVGSVVVDATLDILRHEKPLNRLDLSDRLLANNCVPAGGSGVLASTQLVRDVGGFDPAFSNLADWDLWIRLTLAALVAPVAHPLVAYRVHAGGMAHGVRQTERELAMMTDKYAAERTRRDVAIDWATWFRYLGRLHLRRGDPRDAAKDYFRAGHYGQWSRYVVGVLCLVLPSAATWADRRGRIRVPRSWRAEAQSWLSEQRSATASAVM